MSVTTSSRLVRGLVAALAFALWGACATAAEPEKLITLDAQDADIPRVLAILAEKAGLNLITGPGVTSSRISVRMRDVPVDQAVNLVVRAAGLAYERIGNSILVADARSLKDETGISTYMVELKYADAEDIKDAVKGLSPDISVDKGGNRLVVQASPRVMAEIQKVVTAMDVPVQQVMLEARIVEVSTDDFKQLGVDWDLLNRQGTVIVEGGADPSAPDQLPTELPFISPTPGTNDIHKLRAMSRQAKAFQLALDMLIHEGSARVLANPKIATLNGREASILVGSRVPFVVTGTAFAGGGAAPVQQVQKEEVGIKLRITPVINADGFITTKIEPEVSSIVGFKGANNDLPVVSTRQASTTVRLKDGNSIIIGGLLSEDKTTTVTKVPVLGEIPGIGLLFQHHSITSSKKDLVIEVTPKILPAQQ
jgi:type IV pilus assembly protein PilQ